MDKSAANLLPVQAGENKIKLWDLSNYFPGPNRFLKA